MFKQLSLIQFVEGFETVDTEQVEIACIEDKSEAQIIKTENIEALEDNDFENFVNAEYLENVPGIENNRPAEFVHFSNLEFSTLVKRQASSTTKKHYKRALCG